MWKRLLGTLKNTADTKDSLPRLCLGTFCFVSCFLPDFMLEEIEEMTLAIRSFMQGGHCSGGGGTPTLQAEALLLYQRFLHPSFTDRLRTLYIAGRNWQTCAQLQNGCALVCLDHIESYRVARVMSRVSCPSQTRVHPAPSCALISKLHLSRCN